MAWETERLRSRQEVQSKGRGLVKGGSDVGGSRNMKARLDSSPSDRPPQGQHSGQPEASDFGRK